MVWYNINIKDPTPRDLSHLEISGTSAARLAGIDMDELMEPMKAGKD